MTNREEYEQALASVEHVDAIKIEVAGGEFIWRLYSAGKEFFAGRAGPDQVADMLQATEMLINIEFGVRRRQLCRPALN